MLRDLREWDWRVTHHDDDDAEFQAALELIETEEKKSRRKTVVVGGEVCREGGLDLQGICETEARVRIEGDLWDVEVELRGGEGESEDEAADEDTELSQGTRVQEEGIKGEVDEKRRHSEM